MYALACTSSLRNNSVTGRSKIFDDNYLNNAFFLPI